LKIAVLPPLLPQEAAPVDSIQTGSRQRPRKGRGTLQPDKSGPAE